MRIKYEYNRILGEQVQNHIRKLRQKYFELGDKADRLLARQLKGIRAERAIHKIRSISREIIMDSKLINESFANFYKQLYSAKSNATDNDIVDFLGALDIPVLDDAARQELDSDFTLEEIKAAIRSFPNGKACGPDGFGIEFYKAHIDTVAPLLLHMVSCSLSNGTFPKTLYDAHICLILKKDRDSLDVTSYCPLSLLNCDQKIIAKVLSNRLSNHLGALIHPDQMGFIPERFPFSNTRRILNLIYANNKPYSAVISLDAQQAFDQIEWAYMFNTPKKFGYGERFMTFIKMLYLCPKSSVLTNYDKSPPFHLYRGTRQGCCLSPMLFALALEPLAISIRTSPEIIGIPCSSSVSTVGLYVDDVALTLSDVKTSLSPLLKLIKSFSQLSGFTINWDKSILMPLSDGLDLYYLNKLLFKISVDKFKYLGINITRNQKLLFKYNYLELIDTLKSKIEKWRLLPLSLIG